MSTTAGRAAADERSSAALASVELDITGMTCASCANRIERKLNRLDGVHASVNLATERATVHHPTAVAVDTLLSTVQAAGYGATVPRPATETATEPATTADNTADRLRRRLLVSASLAVPVLVLSMVPASQFDYWQWVALVLATPVVVWGASPFHRAALTNLRHGATTMDTLVSLGVAVAYLWSVYALVLGGAGALGMRHEFSLLPRPTTSADIYLEVAAGVTTFLLLGRWLEARSRHSAGAALRALLELGAKQVTVLRDGTEVRLDVSALVVGDLFVTRPGEKLAADGDVVDGTSAIDRALLTGESVPVEVGPGDAVTGGTVNVGGRLVVRAARVGSDTQLAHMARLVEQAQAGKAAVQRLADRVASVFVPVVLVLALLTLVGWLVAGRQVEFAVTAAVAVLVIACPCALGLATPTALLVGTGRAAQLGILVRGPEVLESTRAVDTIVLDKTGTVTTGVMGLVDVVPAGAGGRTALLGMAGAVEAGSEHPVAAAVVAAARAEVGHLPPVEGFANVPGLGVTGVVRGESVLIGRPRLLAERSLVLPELLALAASRAEAEGRTVVAVAWRGIVRGVLSVSDTVKPTSADAVAQLRGLGLRPVLLTGDNAVVAAGVAASVGIAPGDVLAEVLPADKVAAVRELQRQGHVVAVVGDGVNDAPALAAADLGLAMGTGTDAAIEAGDVTLVRGDLLAAADAIRLARRTLRVIRQNLFWAFAYNTAALPLAAAGLLNPMIGGAAMAFSSVFVVGNSLRLRRFTTAVASTSARAPRG
jgi:Cu+-exporting ATPase